MKRTSNKFRPYNQNQLMVLPPSLDELIDKHHPVRVVNKIIDSLNLENLYRKYQGGGRSSYHPRMLLKVLVYSYLNNIYSSRKMEAALKENIHFMWLSSSNLQVKKSPSLINLSVTNIPTSLKIERILLIVNNGYCSL